MMYLVFYPGHTLEFMWIVIHIVVGEPIDGLICMDFSGVFEDYRGAILQFIFI